MHRNYASNCQNISQKFGWNQLLSDSNQLQNLRTFAIFSTFLYHGTCYHCSILSQFVIKTTVTTITTTIVKQQQPNNNIISFSKALIFRWQKMHSRKYQNFIWYPKTPHYLKKTRSAASVYMLNDKTSI